VGFCDDGNTSGFHNHRYLSFRWMIYHLLHKFLVSWS